MDSAIIPAIAAAPIRKHLSVQAPLERTFEVFTRGMGRWWPRDHSVLRALRNTPQTDVRMEPWPGGRWYEVGENGDEYDWGEVRDWDAPNRIVLIWRLSNSFEYDPALTTEVEVRFIPAGAGATTVDFEHRGLEAFGPAAAITRETMDPGWGMILGRFENLVGSREVK
ncbi:MAG TPA: SRPBCC family protein [Brevundimonas sp.]|nr:SRPBCC family protein [Brevundimonas sp.]